MASPLDSIPSGASHSPPHGELGFNFSNDQGPRINAAMIALIVLATSFTSGRLLSRWLARAGFWWDDFLVVVACTFSLAPCVCNMVAVSRGFGHHIYFFQLEALSAANGYFHTLFFFQLFFVLATGFSKLTVLAFYRRIFPLAGFRVVWIAMTSIVTCFLAASVLAAIFQCDPINKFWNINGPGQCLSGRKSLFVSGSINTLLDFIVVAMPVPLLWRLRTSARQKFVLTGIFLTAGFVCGVSIVRLSVFSEADPSDMTWNYVGVAIWSAVEPCMGVIGACIPSLRPLVTLLFHRPFDKSLRSKTVTNNSLSGSFFSRSKKGEDELRPFSPPQEQRQGEWRSPDNMMHGGRPQNACKSSGCVSEEPEEMVEMEAPPVTGIRVTREVILWSSDRLPYNDRLF